MEDAVVGDVVAQGGFGEVPIEEFYPWINAAFFISSAVGFDDAVEFGLDGGEGGEAGYALGEAEAKNGVVLKVLGEFVLGVGFGGENGGDGEVFNQVLFAVVECGHGDVAGGAIEGEDDVLNAVVVELFANGLEEPLVKLLADALEIFGVAVGIFEEGLEFCDFGGEVFAFDGDFFAIEDYGSFSSFCTPDEPKFVVEDEGIDEDGFDFGIGEDDILGGAGEFAGLQLGGVLALFLGEEFFQPID